MARSHHMSPTQAKKALKMCQTQTVIPGTDPNHNERNLEKGNPPMEEAETGPACHGADGTSQSDTSNNQSHVRID